MSFVLLLPVCLSFLLLAAHFLHHNSLLMVAISLLLPLVLLVRKRWVPWLIQFVLVLAAVEWLSTLLLLIREREEAGEPWKAAAIILSSVMVFTLASGLVFMTSRLRHRYRRVTSPDVPSPACAPPDMSQTRP